MLLAFYASVLIGIVGCGEKPVENTARKKDEIQQTNVVAKKDGNAMPVDVAESVDTAKNEVKNSQPDREQPKPSAKVAAKATPLVVLGYEGIQKLIASHKGKVVVVDAWATYCPPCMKDFHHLVEIHKKYGADKVACVSLSFDYGDDEKLDELKPRVQAFLDRQGATFDNIISNEPWESLYKKFDFAAVPTVFVYGTDGKLIERVDHSGDDETPIYDRVEALVEELATSG